MASKEIIGDDFTIMWGYVVDNHIDILLKVRLCDWFGVGFGDRMLNTDLLLVRVSRVVDPVSGSS